MEEVEGNGGCAAVGQIRSQDRRDCPVDPQSRISLIYLLASWHEKNVKTAALVDELKKQECTMLQWLNFCRVLHNSHLSSEDPNKVCFHSLTSLFSPPSFRSQDRQQWIWCEEVVSTRLFKACWTLDFLFWLEQCTWRENDS